MQITLNQQTLVCPDDITLDTMLVEQQIPTRHIAVAVNQAVVKREDWASTYLHQGDSVLIIGAIKGG